MTFANPNVPALKYGRDMEINTVNTFAEYIIKNYHQDSSILEFGFILDETMPYILASPDQLMSCSCCSMECIEIKCPHSINYNEPNEQNLHYL